MMSGSRLLAFAAVFASFVAQGQSLQQLRQDFQNPPKAAKPWTWWHWMSGNVTKVGIRADLESMKHVGLAGAQIFNVDPGIPHGKVDFLSPQWSEMTRYAAQEANRLGLDLCIHNGAGWSSSGGPWVKPHDAMQVVAFSKT